MVNAHIPAWLGDAASVVLAEHAAEAVALVGAQARGTATPVDAYEILAIVDDEHIERIGWPLEIRWEPLDGFARPVSVLRATMAEAMAAIYCGHPAWALLLPGITALHDPHGIIARVIARQETGPEGFAALQIAYARTVAAEAESIAGSAPGAAAVMVARVHLGLLDLVRRMAGLGCAPDGEVATYLETTAPEAHLALDQVILSGSVASRLTALERLTDGIERLLVP